MAPHPTSFTCFGKFPSEIQDMIWDEALSEVTVLEIDWLKLRDAAHLWASGSPTVRCRDPFTRWGFDATNVALTCKDAAARWRISHPLQYFRADSSYSFRINPKHTILYTWRPYNLERCFSTFPLYNPHIVACKKELGPGREYRDGRITVTGGSCIRSRVARPGSVIKIRDRILQRRSTAVIVRGLLQIIKNPQRNGGRLESRSGPEWMDIYHI